MKVKKKKKIGCCKQENVWNALTFAAFSLQKRSGVFALLMPKRITNSHFAKWFQWINQGIQYLLSLKAGGLTQDRLKRNGPHILLFSPQYGPSYRDSGSFISHSANGQHQAYPASFFHPHSSCCSAGFLLNILSFCLMTSSRLKYNNKYVDMAFKCS